MFQIIYLICESWIQDFNGEALEKFVKESSIPLVTVFDSDPNNHPYVAKFFESPATKVILSKVILDLTAVQYINGRFQLCLAFLLDKYFRFLKMVV